MNRAHLPLKLGTTITIEATGEDGTIVAQQPNPKAATGHSYFVRLKSQQIGDPWVRYEREQIRAHRQDEYTTPLKGV
jgi:DsbC/DsbD-like thiol-disulfide interchange protein